MANTKRNKGSSTKTNTPPKDVHLGDGVADVAKSKANEKMQGIASDLVDMLFNYIESKVKDIPETIKRLRDNPEIKKEVASLWSEQLYAQGVIPEVFAGLSDDLLIHNFHQSGYMDGLYVGHLLTLAAMVEHDMSCEDIDYISKSVYLLQLDYEKRSELIQQLKDKIRGYMSRQK